MFRDHNEANSLAKEKSPYLLQHAYNPVDWFPWGEEAFEKAKRENKPVLVSIGYSTCHWCHVMAHESFEDEEVSNLLNEKFVAIKVDREERPDIDAIYMKVCQAMTGEGGWPLNVFLTPDQKPFYAGTYFPKENRFGRPGFIEVLNQLSEQFQNNREKLENIGEEVEKIFQIQSKNDEVLGEEVLHHCYRELKESFDPKFGGFGKSPKFPAPHQLTFLLRYNRWTGEEEALEIVIKTLDKMAAGGIYDHIGYGFSRYSVDQKWLVPHFEKMLYDQAMLAIAYIEAFQVTGNQNFERVAHEILAYVTRKMRDPAGGFYSAEDADSEGVEGKFYVWTKDEVKEELGEEKGEAFCETFDISEEGNFEGKSIPNYIGRNVDAAKWHKERQKLFEAREKRVHPHKDDKILTSWNGLMIVAFAKASRVFAEPEYLNVAKDAIRFIEEQLTVDNRIMTRFREGEVKQHGFIDDYANMLWSYLEMYETTLETGYLKRAQIIAEEMKYLFGDEENGGFFFYGNDSESLMARPKELYDAAVPSGNSVAASQLLRLAKLTGVTEWEELVSKMFRTFSNEVTYYPGGYSAFLQSLMSTKMKGKEVVALGEATDTKFQQLIESLQREFLPEVSFLAAGHEQTLEKVAPFTKDFKAKGPLTVYICENFSCQQPTSSLNEILDELKIPSS